MELGQEVVEMDYRVIRLGGRLSEVSRERF